MNRSVEYITRLSSIRNQYGKEPASEKAKLLKLISGQAVSSKKTLQIYYHTLLFIQAHPDNKTIQTLSGAALEQLEAWIHSQESIKEKLYNSGITHSSLCAAFSFELVKWLRRTHRHQVKLSSFEATKEQIKFILSAVMPQVESEILQDANAGWEEWLLRSVNEGEDKLDAFIAIFDSSPIRPEVKDELWNAIGINVEIDVGRHACLSRNLVRLYYHRSLIKKMTREQPVLNPTRVKLSKPQAEEIIYQSRMILVRHLREIDPISFTAADLVAYYQLPRGLSIALVGMVPERRHPIDSYMGYVVFKNGLPVAYAGSWILFDSARIGLNVFPAYRGGESQYIFQQVLLLHREVYGLRRFSVDPYQVGKENSDGIHSGAFWVYYRAGFRPLLQDQQDLAASEARKIKANPAYRSSGAVLKKLARSRLQLIIEEAAVSFDATDLSLAWSGILARKFYNNRMLATADAAEKLAAILGLENRHERNLEFVLQNWSLLLPDGETELSENSRLITTLKKLFLDKASGSEEKYIRELQVAASLRRYLERVVKDYAF